MKSKMSIQQLIDEKMYGVVYILARYFYRYGEPIISDAMYDKLEENLKKFYYDTFKEYFERTYDDDPVPTEFLEMIGVRPIQVIHSKEKEQYFGFLNEDKSLSIKSVHGFKEAFEYFQMLRKERLRFVASLKMDGVNTKMLYVDGKMQLSLSRGRNAANSFDYTDNSLKVVPFEVDTGRKMQKIVGESYVLEEALPLLREKYGKPDGYVTSKSATISMLRVAHDREDYKWLKTRVFSIEGLTKSHSEMFEKLQELGFEAPPYLVINWDEIPEDYDIFVSWVKEKILNPIWEKGKGIPSDGVVIEVDDYDWLGTEKNQYVSRQVALKIEQWNNKYYKGVVTGIRIEQQRVFKSIRVEIEPVITHDGSKASVINCFSPEILFSSGAVVGNEVYFERNSNAINVLLYGEKLREVLNEGF